MTTGCAIILNPTLPDSVKLRQCLLDSLRKSGLECSEEIGEDRIIITYHGQPRHVRPAPIYRHPSLLTPVTLEKCLKSRFNCEPDQIEYWDEMIALSAKRESILVKSIPVRTEWESGLWAEAWCVVVSEYLAVNRADGYWTVTHIPTGLAAGSASSLKDAVRIADEVSHWPEWAFLQGKEDITPEFRRKANDAFNSVTA